MVVNAGNMNLHCIKLQFAPAYGLFAAKNSAICCKMHCILVQNAGYFGAKRKPFWCKTQGVLVLNARRNAAKRKAERIKIHIEEVGKTLSNH